MSLQNELYLELNMTTLDDKLEALVQKYSYELEVAKSKIKNEKQFATISEERLKTDGGINVLKKVIEDLKRIKESGE